MPQDREIKITKLGEKRDNFLNDRISVELSPQDLEELIRIFEERLIEATSEYNRDRQRIYYRLFIDAYNLWRKGKGGNAIFIGMWELEECKLIGNIHEAASGK